MDTEGLSGHHSLQSGCSETEKVLLEKKGAEVAVEPESSSCFHTTSAVTSAFSNVEKLRNHG